VWREGEGILTGEEIDALSDTALAAELHKVTVFARVTPEHKLRIVTAYKKRGVIVAMTGDGVNDAPSLVAADLGVSMGKIGTEVAKEASDIVLLDDNFGSIVSAVEEGRGIYKTIKKVLLYLFAGSWSQVLTIVGALSLALPLPLLPAQIIWLNFVTDGFLDVSLAMEPKEKGLLKGNFERPKKYLIDTFMLTRLFFMVVPMTLGALFVFSLYAENDITKAWTMTLTVLAAFHWFNAWNCRHETESIFTLNPFSNKFLVGATVLIIILHLLALYTPLLQSILRTTPLSFTEWLIIVPTALSVVAVEEVRKFFARRRETKNAITVA
jgi:Ca2+-transporting ATPase